MIEDKNGMIEIIKYWLGDPIGDLMSLMSHKPGNYTRDGDEGDAVSSLIIDSDISHSDDHCNQEVPPNITWFLSYILPTYNDQTRIILVSISSLSP